MPTDTDARPRSIPLIPIATAETGTHVSPRRLSALLVRHWHVIVMLMLCAYFVTGTFWRTPWKTGEPYSFDIVINIIERGNWVIPSVTLEPFIKKPLLMYWTSALTALALPDMPPHEAVRLAVLFWMALACLVIWRTARLLRSGARDQHLHVGADLVRGHPGLTLATHRGAGFDVGGVALCNYTLDALLLFAGCIGLVEHVRKFITDIPQLADTAIALYGPIRFVKKSETGGVTDVDVLHPTLWFGTGIDVAFLGKGALMPGLFTITPLAAIALLPDFRSHQAWRPYRLSLLVTLPWLVIQPATFWHESSDLFIEWFQVNSLGRFFGFSHLGGKKGSPTTTIRSVFLTGTPAVQPAVAVLGMSLYKFARQRGRGAHTAWLLPYQGYLVISLFVLATVAVVLRPAVLCDVYLMPLQPVLAVLGAPMLLLVAPARRARTWGVAVTLFGAPRLVVRAVRGTFVTSGGQLLPGWLAKMLGRILSLPYNILVRPCAILVAGAITALWAIYVWLRPARSGVVAWAASPGMVWGLLGTLLMPWVDDAHNYRPLFQAIKPALQSAQICMATRGMGKGERALMHYETDVRPVKWLLDHSGVGDDHRPNPIARTCGLILVLEERPEHVRHRPHGDNWEMIWRNSRPGDTNETFSLFQ